MNEIKPIGECGVDSAQLLVVDPKIYSENWKEEEFKASRRFKHIATGDIISEGEHFTNFERDCLSEYGGKNMNTMIAENEVEQLPYLPAKEVLSYNACCIATLQEDFGILGEGVAAVTRTGIGDGCYDVFPIETKEGTRKGVQAVFIEEFDLSLCMTDCEGQIKVESGLIMLMDPCYIRGGSENGASPQEVALKAMEARSKGSLQMNYDMGHSGLGVLIQVENGLYDVYFQKAEVRDEDGRSWGERVLGIALVKSEE
ncbi:MAG: hypothetical protein P8J32_04800 [bacterium]|nr:hypothetical protein [bacterium]